MRSVSTFMLGLLLGVTAPMAVGAVILGWNGTLTIEIGVSNAQFAGVGSSTAIVNGSGGGGHLTTLVIAPPGAITVTGTTTGGISTALPTLISTRINASLGAGTLKPISGGGPLTANVLPVQGGMKLCLFFPGCGFYIPIPLTVSGTKGMGIGGAVFTANTFSQGPAAIRLTLQGAPWTIGVAVITTDFGPVTRQGFAHGPASATSSTAMQSGVVQLVTPMIMATNLGAPHTTVPMFGVLRLHLGPEPGTALLVGGGLALLGIVGRNRRHG